MKKDMLKRVLIDATSIKSGGGLKHLENFLKEHDNPVEIIVLVRDDVFKILKNKLPINTYIKFYVKPIFKANPVILNLWKFIFLKNYINKWNINIVFYLGGFNVVDFKPTILLIQNQLPLEINEIRKYGISFFTCKLIVLRRLILSSIIKANGIIFLSYYSKFKAHELAKFNSPCRVIYHGLDQNQSKVRIFKHRKYSDSEPLNIFYPSSFEPYKNHLELIRSIERINKGGRHVVLTLAGPITNKNYFSSVMKKCSHTVKYIGNLTMPEMKERYVTSDLLAFPSTCESFGQILIEAMQEGMPIVCSTGTAITELLGESDGFFDLKQPDSIDAAIIKFYDDDNLLRKEGNNNKIRSLKFQWKITYEQSMEFIGDIYESHQI